MKKQLKKWLLKVAGKSNKMIGVIAEFSPFHNGHKYFLEKIKEKYPNESVVIIMSKNYTQRGEKAILNELIRSEVALECGADLVLELPFWYSTQSAHVFAKGAINILNDQSIPLEKTKLHIYFGINKKNKFDYHL